MSQVKQPLPDEIGLNVDEAVRDRYSQAAQEKEQQLCCPVDYDRQFLEIIPQEIIDRDYGCGDPSKYVNPGETVLDLGSGGGKICYIAAQVVGKHGQVIGVDCNDEMLKLARNYQQEMGDRLGYHNVKFAKGKIQDLQLDLELFEPFLREQPVTDSGGWLRAEEQAHQLRKSSPMIKSRSIDVIVSNCVLNLVHQEDRDRLFSEMFRVLKDGGRAVISDIVCDEDVPESLQNDAQLWSGCISGAFREDRFLQAFADAGFYGMEILSRQAEPWAVVEGLEFRSLTVQAFRGQEGACLDRKQAVIYNGPWSAVIDDDGHTLVRGQRSAVCEKNFAIYTRPPYAAQVTPVEPHELPPIEEAVEFDCHGSPVRSPRETKGRAKQLTVLPQGDCCEPDGDCC